MDWKNRKLPCAITLGKEQTLSQQTFDFMCLRNRKANHKNCADCDGTIPPPEIIFREAKDMTIKTDHVEEKQPEKPVKKAGKKQSVGYSSELERRLDETENEVKEFREKNEDLSKEISVLRSKNDSLRNTLTSLTREYTELKDNEEKFSRAKQARETALDACRKSDEQNAKLRQQIKRYRAAMKLALGVINKEAPEDYVVGSIKSLIA